MAHLGLEDVQELIRRLPESLYTTVSHLLVCQDCRYLAARVILHAEPCETVDGLLVWDGLGEERHRALCEEAGLAPEIAGQPAASLPQDIQDRIAWGHELRAGVRILFDDPEGDVLKPTEERNHHALTQPSWQHP